MANYVKALLLVITLIASTLHIVLASKEPAAAPDTPPVVTVEFARVRLIQCGLGKQARVGTAFVYAKDRVMTAWHVASPGNCLDVDTGQPLTLVKSEPELDFATMEMKIKGPVSSSRIDCTGFNTGKTYFSIGWAYGESLVMTTLHATPFYTPKSDMIQKMYAGTLRILTGNIYKGMSGGVIIDENGDIVGMNQATAHNTGYSREMMYTYLCRK